MKTKKVIIFYLLFSFLLSAEKIEMDNLYFVHSPIENRSVQALEKALDNAFELILKRLLGNVDYEVLKKNDIKQFISSYKYTYDKENRLYLDVFFEIASIQRLLSKNHFSFLGKARPLTLFWIVLTENNNKQFLSQIEELSKIQQASEKFYLPTIYPIYDLEDRLVLTEEDIYIKIENAVEIASQRYPHDYVAMVNIEKYNGDKWYYELDMFSFNYENNDFERNILHKQGAEKDLATIAEKMTLDLIAFYANRFQIAVDTKTAENVIYFKIQKDIMELFRFEKTIRQVSLIDNFYISAFFQGEAKFFIQSKAKLTDIVESIKLNNELQLIKEDKKEQLRDVNGVILMNETLMLNKNERFIFQYRE